ncbi:MAG: hypothetical protein ACR2P2_04040 [Nakamurella sp.]
MTDAPFSRASGVTSGQLLEDPQAATFVTMPASSRYFLPFLARERAAADVARELEVDIGSVSYRVRQMLALGLLRVTRRQQRAGRAITYYRSTSDSVFAPLELTPVGTVRELFRRSRIDSHQALDASVEKAWLRVGRDQGWGTILYRPNAGNAVNRDFVPRNLLDTNNFWQAVLSDAAPAVWDQHATLRLSPGSAKDFQRELAGLVHRYSTLAAEPAASDYLIRLAMAPKAR